MKPCTPGRIRDLAQDRVLLQVDHDHLGRMRKVEAVRRGIDREDVPATFATDRDFVLKMIRSIGLRASII